MLHLLKNRLPTQAMHLILSSFLKTIMAQNTGPAATQRQPGKEKPALRPRQNQHTLFPFAYPAQT